MYNQIYDARQWAIAWQHRWSYFLYSNVIPTEVPLLDSYFLLIDGRFASFYVDLLSTANMHNLTDAWMMATLCSLAPAWDAHRQGCNLVPVVSQKEHTAERHTAEGMLSQKNKEMLKRNTLVSKALENTLSWHQVITGRSLTAVEKDCLKCMKDRPPARFFLEVCLAQVRDGCGGNQSGLAK